MKSTSVINLSLIPVKLAEIKLRDPDDQKWQCNFPDLKLQGFASHSARNLRMKILDPSGFGLQVTKQQVDSLDWTMAQNHSNRQHNQL